MFARFLVCLAFLLAPVAALAQSWTLTNTSNEKLTFEIFEPARGSWGPQTIFPHQPIAYRMATPTGKFRIATQGRGYVEYTVAAGRQYTLGWDKNKGMWDFKTVTADANATGGNRAPNQSQYGGAQVAGAWEMLNRSNETITFDVAEGGNWRQLTVYPNENKSFALAPGVTQAKVRVSTQGRGYVMYDVRAGWKYSLLWDPRKSVWDMRTVYRAS
ncbi:MAG TPA: hypothetical protein VIL30_19115 [Ramlibacter sp.]|jgi:hypothetical protein